MKRMVRYTQGDKGQQQQPDQPAGSGSGEVGGPSPSSRAGSGSRSHKGSRGSSGGGNGGGGGSGHHHHSHSHHHESSNGFNGISSYNNSSGSGGGGYRNGSAGSGGYSNGGSSSNGQWKIARVFIENDEALINRRLPKELLLRVFSHLDVVTLCRCAQVSKSWNVLALDGSNWQRVDLFDFQTDIEGMVVENMAKRCGGFLRKLVPDSIEIPS